MAVVKAYREGGWSVLGIQSRKKITTVWHGSWSKKHGARRLSAHTHLFLSIKAINHTKRWFFAYWFHWLTHIDEELRYVNWWIHRINKAHLRYLSCRSTHDDTHFDMSFARTTSPMGRFIPFFAVLYEKRALNNTFCTNHARTLSLYIAPSNRRLSTQHRRGVLFIETILANRLSAIDRKLNRSFVV